MIDGDTECVTDGVCVTEGEFDKDDDALASGVLELVTVPLIDADLVAVCSSVGDCTDFDGLFDVELDSAADAVPSVLDGEYDHVGELLTLCSAVVEYDSDRVSDGVPVLEKDGEDDPEGVEETSPVGEALVEVSVSDVVRVGERVNDGERVREEDSER